MTPSPLIGTDIDLATRLLTHGGLVAIPTETVYGLGANALDVDAVARIFEAKNRPSFDPLIVHVGSMDQIAHYAQELPPALQRLAEHFMPGPLTILVEKQALIPDLVTSGLPKVGIRIPDHPLTLALLQSVKLPIAAPSANPFGYISPTTAQHVADQLAEKVDYILDGGPCTVGIESTIVGMDQDGQVVVHRKGGLAIEAIEEVLGQRVVVQAISTSRPEAPGQLLIHYAPKTPIIVGHIPTLCAEYRGKKIGILSFDGVHEAAAVQLILSPTRDYKEAAKNLFAYMRQLDLLEVEVIVTEFLPEEHLGIAINDRLRRAASRS